MKIRELFENVVSFSDYRKNKNKFKIEIKKDDIKAGIFEAKITYNVNNIFLFAFINKEEFSSSYEIGFFGGITFIKKIKEKFSTRDEAVKYTKELLVKLGNEIDK